MSRTKNWDILRKNGDKVQVEWTLSFVEDPGEEGRMLVVTCLRDITELVNARGKERINNAILESISDSIILKDTQGTIKQTNTAAERLFG